MIRPPPACAAVGAAPPARSRVPRYADGISVTAAVRLDAGSAKARLGLADALFSTGRAGEALSAYRAAVRLDAGSAPAWHGLAKALAMCGRDEEAGRSSHRASDLEASE